MRTRLIHSIIITCLIVTTGCTTLKRYSSLSEPAINNEIAGIDLFGLKLSQPEPGGNSKSLWDLSADAQSQFIKILNTRYPDNEMFLNSFNLKYLKVDDHLSAENYADRDLRLIFSVSKIRKYSSPGIKSGIIISPADRLEYIHISLRVPEDSVLRFKNWNMYVTEYGTVDIGQMSFSRTLQLNAPGSVSFDNGNTSAEMAAGGTSTLNRKEDQALKYRYLLLNGRINERGIEMEEEGTRDIDLTGNIIADVSMGFYSFPETLTDISGFMSSTGEYNNPENTMVDFSVVRVPVIRDIKDTIKAELKMEFVYRNVIRGSKTFPEWDDRVRYYTGTVKKLIPLLTANDYVPDLYCIGSDRPARDLLKIRTSDNYLYDLKFRSYDEASSFYTWLMQYLNKNGGKASVINIGGQPLIYRDDNLNNDQIKGDLRFRVLPYYR